MTYVHTTDFQKREFVETREMRCMDIKLKDSGLRNEG